MATVQIIAVGPKAVFGHNRTAIYLGRHVPTGTLEAITPLIFDLFRRTIYYVFRETVSRRCKLKPNFSVRVAGLGKTKHELRRDGFPYALTYALSLPVAHRVGRKEAEVLVTGSANTWPLEPHLLAAIVSEGLSFHEA